jgi:hypothetical protein
MLYEFKLILAPKKHRELKHLYDKRLETVDCIRRIFISIGISHIPAQACTAFLDKAATVTKKAGFFAVIGPKL